MKTGILRNWEEAARVKRQKRKKKGKKGKK